MENYWQRLKTRPNFKTAMQDEVIPLPMVLAGGSAVATTTFPWLKAAWSKSQPNIAIIGGGLAGLNAAYQLKKAGLIATVYEAKSRVGGRVHSVTGVAGKDLVSDLGGLFINSDHEDILALVEEFNLSLFNRIAHGEKSPFPLEAYFFNNKLYSEAEVAEKLRPLARQIALDADLLDRDFEGYAPIIDRLSVAEYLDKHGDKITEPFIRVLLANTIRTEYGVEPEFSSALQLIYNLATVEYDRVTVLGGSDEAYVVRGGSGKIIDSLEAAIPQQIQTNKRLIQIQAYGDGYRLIFRDRSVVDADYVIIAIPSYLHQTFLERFQQIIPQAKSSATEKSFYTNWYSDPLIGGSYTNFKPGQYTEFSKFLYVESEVPEENQDVSFGNLVFAGEHLSDEFYGYMTELPPYKNTIYSPKAHAASTIAVFSFDSIHGHKKDILTPTIAIAI
ncbi:MAG: flavin monoamine oxidase family protein [Xenococcaceae cyanobacterium]